MMIVRIPMFVTKEVVLMHVDYLTVESTPNAKLVVIWLDVYVCQGIQETLALLALHVSSNLFLLYCLTIYILLLSCMILF